MASTGQPSADRITTSCHDSAGVRCLTLSCGSGAQPTAVDAAIGCANDRLSCLVYDSTWHIILVENVGVKESAANQFNRANTLTRTSIWLSIEAFMLLIEGRFCFADRYDVHAVEVFAIPILDLFHHLRIGPVGG